MANQEGEKKKYDKYEDMLLSYMDSLKSDFESLTKAINFNEENPRKLALLVNAKSRIFQEILYCVALLRNPKLNFTFDSGRKKDFAEMIKNTLLSEHPVVSKLVKETAEEEAVEKG